MTQSKEVTFSKKKKTVQNMDIVTYRFDGGSIASVQNTYTLSQEGKQKALDKMLDAYPNYLDMPEEEQYGLIATTMTLETLVMWLIAQEQVDGNPSMYNAYMDIEDCANIEFFYIDNEKNQAILNDAFQKKSGNVAQMPRKSEQVLNKKKTATIHPIKEGE